MSYPLDLVEQQQQQAQIHCITSRTFPKLSVSASTLNDGEPLTTSHSLSHGHLTRSDFPILNQVRLIDNFTNKKGMTGHCYRIAYRSMERSLTDEEINQLQLNVRDQVQSRFNVVLR